MNRCRPVYRPRTTTAPADSGFSTVTSSTAAPVQPGRSLTLNGPPSLSAPPPKVMLPSVTVIDAIVSDLALVEVPHDFPGDELGVGETAGGVDREVVR